MILSGTELSLKIKEKLKDKASLFLSRYGRVPHLTVILVGDDPASLSYVRGKAKACEYVGIKNTTIHKEASVSEKELLDVISGLNSDDSVDGILVQLPLPGQIDEQTVIEAISYEKDVDGFHPVNVAGLWTGCPHIAPCTPKGIMTMLSEAGVSVSGKRAVIVGRSRIVGLPMAKMLLDKNATVTVCHSKTENLGEIVKTAEILVVAVGRAGMITADMVAPGTVVIDVGINRNPEDGKLCGDVDFEEVSKVARLITPVPGGVGPMTITSLLQNTFECFERKMKV